MAKVITPSRRRRGARTAWNGPTSNLRGQWEAGSRDHRGCASTQTHNEHTARPERATGPSSRNAQTEWNGVPAGGDKGHPDRATPWKQFEGHEGGTARGEGPREAVPALPSQFAASAAHTPSGHRTRIGSSGAQRYATTPWLGSLRASPWQSVWQQASSTDPAARGTPGDHALGGRRSG